jgi:putative ABC transport system permease protein
VVLLAASVSTCAAVAGALGAVWRAVRLPPAEAMRPEPPTTYRPTLLERVGLGRLLSPVGRMVLRQLERRPLRAALTGLGIALAVAVLILGHFMVDALDYVMESEFQRAQRQDVSVTFVEPTSGRALHELQHLPGVGRAEPFRAVAVRLRAGPRSRRVALTGLPADAELFRLLDLDRRQVTLPADGLVLSAKLAEVLGMAAGDSVTVEVLEGERPVREVPVAVLVADFAGTSAYMNLQALHRLLREGDVLSGAHLAVDPARLDELYRALKGTPQVAGVSIKGATLISFQRTIAENLLRMRLINVIFAGIIAFGVVYNSARIALAERDRELATLRVLGFTRAEVSAILLGELAVLTLAGLPVGLLLGRGLAGLVIWLAYDTELFRIPLVIGRATYGFAAAVTLATALISGLVVRRRLDRLDLIAVLKSRE